MRQPDEESFRRFAVEHAARLRRSAYLCCGDWHLAEDLMQSTLIKIYRHWTRVEKDESLASYSRTVLLRTWLDEKRRPWRREQATEELPELPTAEEFAVVGRAQLLDLLDGLPPKRRAVVVLRLYCDLSVEETAEILGCTVGTVKSQTARGLDTLRANAAKAD